MTRKTIDVASRRRNSISAADDPRGVTKAERDSPDPLERVRVSTHGRLPRQDARSDRARNGAA